MKTAKLLLLFFAVLLAFGCATAPEVKYAVEAEKVTTQALEPVMIETADLESEVGTKWTGQVPKDAADELTKVIQTEIANTKRFTKVLLNTSEGDTYIVQPHIDKINLAVNNIPSDPTRKKVVVKAKARLDVVFINQRNQKELVKSFYDERTLEDRVKGNPDEAAKQEYHMRALKVAFRSAADQLGNGFNPSYEMGTVARLNGKTAYVQINTSKLRKMPKKQQAVEVVDEDNKVLARIGDPLKIEDGSLSGTIFEKSGATVREGAKVRAKVNALTD
ncbi:MAG: hypothetical protein HYV06_02630 [Deltaproteobacteria bacterium]|nr:hypothetical protein [Deltaproteobacteria bacterium]